MILSFPGITFLKHLPTFYLNYRASTRKSRKQLPETWKRLIPHFSKNTYTFEVRIDA